MAPQYSQNCDCDFAKRKQTDAEFAANSLLRMVIIDIAINVLLSTVTRHRAGMHCLAGDDAFVSSFFCFFLSRSESGATQFSHSSLGGATIFAKLRSKIAKSPKIGGKVCAHHFV